jgi:heme oxygenase
LNSCSRLIEDTADLHEILDKHLSFKCEFCDDTGYHVCIPRLLQCCEFATDIEEVLDMYFNLLDTDEELDLNGED